MAGFLQNLVERLPGSWQLGKAKGFAFGPIAAADLPTCNTARDGEHRWITGGTGVADSCAVCEKDAADAFAWRNKGHAYLEATYAHDDHEHALDDLSDVDTTGVADADVLTYDEASETWIPAAGGGGGGITLEQALDHVGTALVAGNNIDIVVDDALDQITISVETLTPADIGADADLATFSVPASTTISAFGATLVDDANAAAAIATLGLDTDIATLALPASTTISAFGATLVDDANAAAAIATLGLDTDIATLSLPASTTISAFGATLLDDANEAAARDTLGLIAGDAGDIWVEKAGDTMTAVLNISGAAAGLDINSNAGYIDLANYTADANGAGLFIQKSRHATVGSHTVVQDDDSVGGIVWMGSDGTNFEATASILSFVDNSPGNNDMPGRLVLSTTADGAVLPTVRQTIDSTGLTTFTGDVVVPDEAYDATAWNGSLEVPTKNAVRDKFESLSGGGVNLTALTLIDEEAFSGVASVSLPNNTFSATYANYLVVLDVDSTSGVADILLRFRVAGTDDSGAGAYSRAMYAYTNVATSGVSGAADTSIMLFDASTGASLDVHADFTIYAPVSASTRTGLSGSAVGLRNGLDELGETISGQYGTDRAHDSFTILVASGTFSGTVRVYGLQNTPGAAGSGAFPAGADTQIQFNDAGNLGGDAGLVYNKTTDVLTAGGVIASAGSTTRAPIVLTSGTNLTTPAAGAIEYDGTGLYWTHNTTSDRGIVDGWHEFYLTAAGGAIGNAIADFFGANSSINLPATSRWVLEAKLVFLKTTAGTVLVTVTNSAANWTSFSGHVEIGSVIGTNAMTTLTRSHISDITTAAAAFAATASLTTAVTHTMTLGATFMMNAAGNVRIRVTESAGTVTPQEGSYYRVRRAPANAGDFVA